MPRWFSNRFLISTVDLFGHKAFIVEGLRPPRFDIQLQTKLPTCVLGSIYYVDSDRRLAILSNTVVSRLPHSWRHN